MASKSSLILRSPRSGRLEGRTKAIPPTAFRTAGVPPAMDPGAGRDPFVNLLASGSMGPGLAGT